MAGVGGAPGRGQLGGHPRQQVRQGECLDTGHITCCQVRQGGGRGDGLARGRLHPPGRVQRAG